MRETFRFASDKPPVEPRRPFRADLLFESEIGSDCEHDAAAALAVLETSQLDNSTDPRRIPYPIQDEN